MIKKLSFIVLISVCLLKPIPSDAKRKRLFKRKWSVSVVNGYSFYQHKKNSQKSPEEWGDLDGQMNWFFSALEVSRNMGHYELGAKIQNLGPTFVSPFIKWNVTKNNSRSAIVPSLTLGVVPAKITGVWLRAGLGLSLNKYITVSPFAGTYIWYEVKDTAKYGKSDIHANVGLRLSLYY